jgi:hypothetical protein
LRGFEVCRADVEVLFCRHADHESLKPASSYAPKDYPAPDNEVSFSLNDSLYRSGTNHDHDQPPHLRLRNPGVPASVNWPIYAGPESRYCPAGERLMLILSLVDLCTSVQLGQTGSPSIMQAALCTGLVDKHKQLSEHGSIFCED